MRKAFTLVELLIVIGIVAVLLSLLLPALAGSRESARGVVCLSNLRQMAVAAQAYCSANGGSFPVARWTSPGGVAHEWDFTTTHDPGGRVTVKPGLLWMGATDLRVQQCPAFAGPSNTPNDPHTGYNYNVSYVGGGEGETVPAPAKIRRVKNLAGCALFGDGEYRAGANKFMRSPQPGKLDAGFASRTAGTQGYRHRGRTNVAFCDGHAESLSGRFTQTSDFNRIPDRVRHVGFLSPDNSMYDLE